MIPLVGLGLIHNKVTEVSVTLYTVSDLGTPGTVKYQINYEYALLKTYCFVQKIVL